MSLMNQFMSPGFVESLSDDDKMHFLKDVIVEYIDTHTDEENARLVAMLKDEVSGGVK